MFVDYNQNARDRTIRSAWSLRAVAEATVSAPRHLGGAAGGRALGLHAAHGPRAAGSRTATRTASIDDVAHDLTPVLDWYDRDVRDEGLDDMPYPPDYPKMPGEPKRVQPSRAKAPEEGQEKDPDG